MQTHQQDLRLNLDETDVKKVVEASKKCKQGKNVLYRDLVNNFLEVSQSVDTL